MSKKISCRKICDGDVFCKGYYVNIDYNLCGIATTAQVCPDGFGGPYLKNNTGELDPNVPCYDDVIYVGGCYYKLPGKL